jgi:hypothetical protein
VKIIATFNNNESATGSLRESSFNYAPTILNLDGERIVNMSKRFKGCTDLSISIYVYESSSVDGVYESKCVDAIRFQKDHVNGETLTSRWDHNSAWFGPKEPVSAFTSSKVNQGLQEMLVIANNIQLVNMKRETV